MEIRILKKEDAPLYWELRLEALKGNPEAFASSYEEALEKKNPIGEYEESLESKGAYTFGAFINGRLVGVVTLVQESAKKLRHTAMVFAMYVTPSTRGKGVGKKLLEHIILFAKKLDGVLKLNLTVVATNEHAKGLYKSVGFTTFGLEEKALKVDDTFYDEENMVLFL